MNAVLFVLRAVVLVLLWAFVIAAVLAVRHDVFGTRPARQAAARQATVREPAARRPATREAAPARSAAKPKARGRSAPRRLVVTGGPLAGTTLPLADTPITIGRADGSTLVLTDDYVSTHHARLVPQGDTWVLEDLGSTNGTYVDKKRVSAPTPVPPGTPIQVGKTVLELRR